MAKRKETDAAAGGGAPSAVAQGTGDPSSHHGALTKKSSTDLTTQGGRGFDEQIDKDDLIFPRAILLQALSPQVQEHGLKQGTIINHLTLDTLPDIFIPVFMFKNWIRFNPRKDNDPAFDRDYKPGEIIWRSSDADDPKVISESKFGDDGEKPLATTFMNFFSYFPGLEMPILLSFSVTSYKAGKKLFSLAKFLGGDMFSRQYKLEASEEYNAAASAKYFIYKTAPAGEASPEDFAIAEAMWKTYYTKRNKIEVEGEGEGNDGAGAGKVPF